MKLVENGMHSFKKSLDNLFKLDQVKVEEKEYYLKDIVIDFHHALETLFKYLIEKKNKYLIYDDSENLFNHLAEVKFKHKVKKYNLKTIKFMDAFNRVIVLYDIEIDNETYTQVNNLNLLRNALTHFECKLTSEEVEFIISSIIENKDINKVLKSNIEEFNIYREDDDIKDKMESLYSYRDIWLLKTIINIIESKMNNFDANTPCEGDNNFYKTNLQIIGFDFEDFLSAEEFLNNKFEMILYNNEFISNIKKSENIIEWCNEHKSSFICQIKKIIYNKLITILSSLLNENRNFYKSEYEKIELNTLKHGLDESGLSAKIFIYKQLRDINVLLSSYKSIIINDKCEWLKSKKQYYFEKINSYIRSTTEVKNEIQIECKIDQVIKEFNKIYKENGWLYIGKEYDNLYDIIVNLKGYDELIDSINDDVKFGEISSEIISRSYFGDLGTIDLIDDCSCYIDYIIGKHNDTSEYEFILDANLSTQTYFDHDMFDNGYIDINIYVKISIDANNGTIVDSEFEFLGKVW